MEYFTINSLKAAEFMRVSRDMQDCAFSVNTKGVSQNEIHFTALPQLCILIVFFTTPPGFEIIPVVTLHTPELSGGNAHILLKGFAEAVGISISHSFGYLCNGH